jgi:hypothetical protein
VAGSFIIKKTVQLLRQPILDRAYRTFKGFKHLSLKYVKAETKFESQHIIQKKFACTMRTNSVRHLAELQWMLAPQIKLPIYLTHLNNIASLHLSHHSSFLLPFQIPKMDPTKTTNYLIHLLEERGTSDYIGESISQLEHSLQCANFALTSGTCLPLPFSSQQTHSSRRVRTYNPRSAPPRHRPIPAPGRCKGDANWHIR